MSKERLSSVFHQSESVESQKNFDDGRIKKIKKDFNELRDRFFKPKIKEIRRNLYELEKRVFLNWKSIVIMKIL